MKDPINRIVLMIALSVAFSLSAQPAFSATIFVDAAAPPGGDGSTPARAFTSLVDAVAAARTMQRQGALVIHLAAGTYTLQASKRDGLLIDVPRLLLEGETQLSFDAAGDDIRARDHRSSLVCDDARQL